MAMPKKTASQAFDDQAKKIAEAPDKPQPTKQDLRECPPIVHTTTGTGGARAEWSEYPQNLTRDQMRAKFAQKLLQVYGLVGYIQKKNKNKQQGYTFVSEADFAEKVSDALIEAKLALIPSYKTGRVEAIEVEGQTGKRLLHTASVDGTFTLIDAETGYTESFGMPGASHDYGDKAIYKAITGAQKYAYYKMTLCATGDDPEEDTVTTAPKEATRPAQTPSPKPTQVVKGNGGGGGGSPPDTQKPVQTQGKPKETHSSGTPEVGFRLQGESSGVIKQVEAPKAPQKPGWILFQVPKETEPLKIWFWVERLPSGVTVGDLVSFMTNKTEFKLYWTPDTTGKWATIKGLEMPLMQDLNDPGYLDEAADQFAE